MRNCGGFSAQRDKGFRKHCAGRVERRARVSSFACSVILQAFHAALVHPCAGAQNKEIHPCAGAQNKEIQRGKSMNFEFSDKVKDLQKKVSAFMQEHVNPRESRFFEEIAENRAKGNAWIPTRIVEELKPKARAAGLWNLWQPKDHGGSLTNLEYAPLCEIM